MTLQPGPSAATLGLHQPSVVTLVVHTVFILRTCSQHGLCAVHLSLQSSSYGCVDLVSVGLIQMSVS